MRMLSPVSTAWSLPSRASSTLFDDIDRLFNGIASPNESSTGGFGVSCDINEDESHFFLSFDLPGVKKEDLEIEVKENTLSISGERKSDFVDETNSLRRERRFGRFERRFSLSSAIDSEKIEARHEAGVLTLTLPKAEKAVSRKIEVS